MRLLKGLTGFTVLAFLAFAIWSENGHAQKLPPGKGRFLLERECGECHPIEVTANANYPRQRWRAIVEDMVAKGARLSRPEMRTLVEYLAKNFPDRGQK